MAEEQGANEYGLEWSDASSNASSLYSPSLDDDFSDDEYEYLNEWTETSLRAKDVKISMDSVGTTLVNNYLEEKTHLAQKHCYHDIPAAALSDREELPADPKSIVKAWQNFF